MSRNYCTVCGSHRTAPLGFISHSFSLMELKFIYHHVLPDLSGKVLVDVGSRLGTVLYGVKCSLWTYSTCGKYFLLLATALPATVQGLPLQLSSAALWGRAEWRVLPIAGNDHKEIPVR